MALTPGSAQLPLTPNKQWLYIADPYTDGLIGYSPAAIALQDSLFCYAHAQGYTGIFLYEMKNYVSGGSFGANSFDITFFNGRAYDKGLEVGAVFGGPSVLDAVINFNNSNGVGSFLNFTTVISEIEWWNYSSNLPFQEPGPTGTYSFFDTLQMIKSYKSQLTAAGIELYTYNGFTKAFQEEYNSGFEVIGAGTDYLTIKGNYTSTGPDSIVGGKMFEANQVIRVDNWPVEGNHTFYKLDATTPVTLVSGNTQLKVGTGKQYAGVGTSTTGTTLLSTFTGIGTVTGSGGANDVAYGTKNIGLATVNGGILTLISPGTIPTVGTKVEITGNTLPFTPLGLLTTTVITGGIAGGINITSPTINNITQKQASGGTTLITTGVPHGIANGDTILISGLGTGFDGTWVITGSPTTTSFTFNNGNPALSVPTTPDSGAYRIMTTSNPYFYSNNLYLRPLNLNNAEVRVEFEVTSITPWLPTPGILTEVKLRGDKTFMFTPTNTIGSNTFLRSAAGVFKWSGGISGLKLIPPIGGGSGILPTYNAGTNETTFYIAGTFTGTAFDAGFLYGMVNFDVCYGAGGSYDNTTTYLFQSYGSELEQCSPYVNVFGLHDYVTNRPSYTYTQSRTLELGQAGTSISNPDIKISWIISAEPEYLQPFFEGDPGLGVSRKTPIDAYKYLGYPITPTPNPTQSANTISSEPDADVQSEVYVDGVIIFKDSDIRAVPTGNGPNVWVNAGNDLNITGNSGSMILTGEYCDDCLPSSNYSYEWSIISANPIGGATVSPNTGTLVSGCPGGTAPATFVYTSPGVYTVRLTVTDNTGVAPAAVGQDELEIIINSAFTGPFDVVINPDTQPTCTEGDPGVVNDGDITASISAIQAPVKPVTFTWNKNGVFYTSTIDNTGSPTASSTITNVGPGVYDVTAVDSSSPPISGTQTYTLNALYNFSNDVTVLGTPPTCYGGSDGSAQIFINASNCPIGFSPTILWNTGATTTTISGLVAGTYTAVITDCTGCTATKSITLVEPDAIIPTIVGTDTTCGYANGSATISSITGGVPPLTYSWSNGDTNATTNNLSPGLYSVIVTDSTGCTGVSNPVEILSSTGPSISISGPANVCCGQKATFTASVTSTEPYTVNWSNGGTGLTTDYIISGKDCDAKFGSISAQVVYTNAPFCSSFTTFFFNVNTPANPVTGIKVLSGDPNNLTVCPGDAVVIEPIGGLGSSFGTWNFGSPLSTTIPLTVDQAWFTTYGTPGDPFTFTWSETDPFTGCYSEASITINYPVGVTVEIEVTPVTCGGALDSGAIDVTVLTSCSDPYIITWTGPVSGSDTFGGPSYTITNLTEGFYEVYVEDPIGNSVTVPDIEVYTSVPEITEAVVTNYCFNTPVNSNSGAINITVAGGTAPYTYLWTKTGDPSFSETTQDISDLSLGTYTVVVTDDNGCTATDTYTIEYADPIQVAFSLAAPSCWGLCNGFVEIEVSGGVLPYTLTLEGQDPAISFDGSPFSFKEICATTYSVDIVDANGCSYSTQFNAGATTSIITFTDRVEDPTSDSDDGAIYIDTIQGGGGPPYSYSWTGPNGFTATTQDITGLAPGEYEVTIQTVIFGVPEPLCAVTKKYIIQQACVEFSLEDLKVMLFKFQCCAGVLAKEYVQYQEIGRPDLAECKLIDLKYLTLAINALSCIDQLPDPCLSCEDISNILNQIKKICDCDCCDDAATAVYNVSYNPFTGQLDSNSSVNP